MQYPATPQHEIHDVLHGQLIADQYRYLEEPENPLTVDFIAAQHELSRPYLAALPARDEIRDEVFATLAAPRRGTPWQRGGRYFQLVNPGGQDQDVLVSADSLDELDTAATVIFDPVAGQPDTALAIASAAVSPDGQLVAVAVPEAGSDWHTICVIDAASGADQGELVRWSKFSVPCWLPDSSGFCYWRFAEPTDATATDALGAGYLVIHRLGTAQDQDEVLWHRASEPDWVVSATSSSDGAYLMLTASRGTDVRSLVTLRRWNGTGYDAAQDIITELADEYECVDVIDGQLIMRTHAQAPRGRLIGLNVDMPSAPPQVVVAEHHRDVLVSAQAISGGFLLVWSQDASHRVQFRPDSGPSYWLDLPAASSVVAVHGDGTDPVAFCGMSSFTHRLRSFAFEAPTQTVTELSAGSQADPLPVHTERLRVTSSDGAQVPMTLVRRADAPPGPAPCLLYGYGGFNIPITPTFSALFASWVARGGVLAVANLRGGGEFGHHWHVGGMRERKQQVFDDLYACANGLRTAGIADGIAVHGRSNGGLLAAVALVQRPQLWAAVLPVVGVLDMLRFHRFTIGRAWTAEYGDPDDPADFPTLLAYSPLHNLTEDTDYPPTLICTGDHDDRVVPAHSLKFAARLQACQSGPGPILLRVDTRAGHGMGKPLRALADEYADQIAFAAVHTGLMA